MQQFTVAVTFGIPEEWSIHNEGVRMHQLNSKWWHDIDTGEPLDLDRGERIFLVMSELVEAGEAYRKNLMDDHLPQYKGEVVEIADTLIRLFDMRYGYGYYQVHQPGECALKATGRGNVLGALAEIAFKLEAVHFLMYTEPNEPALHAMAIDQVIEAVFNYAWWRGYGGILREVYEAKAEYNMRRIDHTHEHRRGEHGKKV